MSYVERQFRTIVNYALRQGLDKETMVRIVEESSAKNLTSAA